jgi:hypothetical protein
MFYTIESVKELEWDLTILSMKVHELQEKARTKCINAVIENLNFLYLEEYEIGALGGIDQVTSQRYPMLDEVNRLIHAHLKGIAANCYEINSCDYAEQE